MRFDFRLALMAVAVGLIACRDQRRAYPPSAAAVTRADTVALARGFAQALARADTEEAPVREKLRSPAADLRARSGEGAWELAVLRELHALRPQLFEQSPAAKTIVWLAINPLDLRGDTAVAWAGWYRCPGDGNAFSLYYRFIRHQAPGRWKPLPPERGSISNVFCIEQQPGVSPDTAQAASHTPAA